MGRMYDAVETDENFYGGILLVFITVSVISMIMFGCVDPPQVDKNNKDAQKDQRPATEVSVSCCDIGR